MLGTRTSRGIILLACRIVIRIGKHLPPGGVLLHQEQQPLLARLERRMEAAALAGDVQACRRFALAWYRAWHKAMRGGIHEGEAYVMLKEQERLMQEGV